ncbi:MAG TPA: hypothetical protein EYG86_07425 [Crocinitomicaceae bacterium]|nr:hypothetical protein [Crocinitomicaceae bacterium]
MRIKLLVGFILIGTSLFSQDVEETFSGTRILNGHSTETLKKGALEFIIAHRFGDVAGTNGGVQQFFGFDQAADIRFAFEYGVTDKIMIGLGRSKGTGAPYRSLVDGFAKWRLLTQNKERGIPVSLALFGGATITYMTASTDSTSVQSFPKFSHRLAYATQLHIARKFGERVSIAIIPSYVHRNLVAADDVNGLFAVGGAFNFKFTKEMGMLFEYYHAIHDNAVRTTNFNSLSAGFEYQTNGHNFKIVWTNARGFNETQFIPYTYSDWTQGQFRLGFSISRTF